MTSSGFAVHSKVSLRPGVGQPNSQLGLYSLQTQHETDVRKWQYTALQHFWDVDFEAISAIDPARFAMHSLSEGKERVRGFTSQRHPVAPSCRLQEHTSPTFAATVHGAYESGQRAADDIMNGVPSAAMSHCHKVSLAILMALMPW